jgi:hypothetical protein
MIEIASDIGFADYLAAEKPASVEIFRITPEHAAEQVSSELVLFGLSLAASVPLNLVSSWLWSKIEARKAKHPTVRINVYVRNMRVFTQAQMLEILTAEREAGRERGNE